MAMNKFMHPRNPYKIPPDFKKMALDYPDFRKHANQDLSGKVRLNFKDDGAVWSLTKSLLHKDFGLDVQIVEGRLVPTLPLRMNYLLWLEDLVNLYKIQDQVIRGIDIGTGACCIYPLLGSRHFSWQFLATEIDEENFECAVENVKRNNLQELIKVEKVKEGTYLCGIIDENSRYDFCMCNPPFFGDDREPKRRNEGVSEPRNAPSGSDIELITEGGEISFVKAIIDDSTKLSHTIRIFSVMLGCKSSVAKMKEYLEKKHVSSLATTLFCQGRTTRWGIAWTYDSSVNLPEECKHLNKKHPSASYHLTISVASGLAFATAVERVVDFLKELEVTIENELHEEGIIAMTLNAHSNTWINSRRKRREEKRKLMSETCKDNENSSLIDDKDKSIFDVCKVASSSKRRCEFDNGSAPKQIKFDVVNKNYFLTATLTIKNLGNKLNLEIIYLEGIGGKDCAHQLLQCIKNKFK